MPSAREIAGHLGVTARHVARMVGRGMPTTSLEAAAEWRKKHLQQGARNKGDGAEESDFDEPQTIAEQTRRLRKAQADLAELEAAARSAELAPVADMRDAWSESIVMCASQMDSIAGRCAARLAVMTDVAEIRDYLLKETRAIREAMSLRLQDWARSIGSGEAADASSESDTGPVG
jgi:phage terminase Nu1 subunit (DNA packaging protein)